MIAGAHVLEWVIGALFICFHSYQRYNTAVYPGVVDNRSTTTFSRFSTFFGLYLGTLLVIYWLFGSMLRTSPDVVARLLAMFGGSGQLPLPSTPDNPVAEQFTGPIVAALMLTTLLPGLPVLQTFDRWLLRKFWELGRIPVHVFRQSETLRRSPQSFAPGRRNAIARKAGAFGVSADALVFEDKASVEYEWVRLCNLILELEEWQNVQASRYARFLHESEEQYEEIKLEFTNISTRFGSYIRRRKIVEQERKEDTADLLKDFERQLIDAIRARFKRVCTFVTFGVFAAELSERRRRDAFAQMGFEQDTLTPKSLSSSQVVTLIFWIAFAFLSISVLEKHFEDGKNARLGMILFDSLIMTISYGAAAIAGLIPKNVLNHKEHHGTEKNPLVGYLLSAFLAVIFGLFAMISIRYTFGAAQGLEPSDNVGKVINNLSWSYPFLVQSAAIGFAIGFVADRYRAKSSARIREARVFDTFMLGLTMLAATAVTYSWLEGVGPFEPTRDAEFRGRDEPILFISKGTVVGLVIGFLVPSWYRLNQMQTPIQQLSQFLVEEASAVAREAGQLRPGELEDAVVACAAYIAAADGRVDPIEQHVMRQSLFKLAAAQAVDFSIDDATEEFERIAYKLQFLDSREPDAALASLRPIVGRKLLSEAIIYMGFAIAHADDVFDDTERAAMGTIISELNIDSEKYTHLLRGA